MTANERIKQIRKTLKLSQAEFASQLGLTQPSIAALEGSPRPPQERHIKAICNIYGVDEHWLRTGEGEMFPPKTTEDELIDAFSQLIQAADNPLAQKIILTLAQMTPDEWDMAAAFIEKFLANSERIDKEKVVIEVETKKEEET